MDKYIVIEFVTHSNDDGSFTIRTADLPITTEGDTLEEAQANVLDAVTEFGAALFNAGMLEQVLRQHGVTIHEGSAPTEWVPKSVPRGFGESLWTRQHQLPAYA